MTSYQHFTDTVAQIPNCLPTSTNIYHVKHMRLDDSLSTSQLVRTKAEQGRYSRRSGHTG